MKRPKWKFTTGDKVKFEFSDGGIAFGGIAVGRIMGVDRGIAQITGFSYYKIAVKQPYIRSKVWWIGEQSIIRKLPKRKHANIKY